MKSRWILAAVLSCVGYSVQATDVLPLAFCYGCNDSEIYTEALSHGFGKVYVADPVFDTVHAFNVYADVDDSKRPPVHIKVADTITPVEPYLSAAENAIHFFNAETKGWSKSLTLTTSGVLSGLGPDEVVRAFPDSTTNVYDVIDPGPTQNNLTDWAGSGVVQALNRLALEIIDLGATFHLIDMSAVPKLAIIVTFSDGSHVTVNADFTTTSARYFVDTNSGRDSHNNNVPPTKQAATCSGAGSGTCKYGFDGPGNGTDRDSWQHRMSLLGITVRDDGVNKPGGMWACVKSGDGDSATYTCERVN